MKKFLFVSPSCCPQLAVKHPRIGWKGPSLSWSTCFIWYLGVILWGPRILTVFSYLQEEQLGYKINHPELLTPGSRPWVLCCYQPTDYRRAWSVASWGSVVPPPSRQELHIELCSQRLQRWAVSKSSALYSATFTLRNGHLIRGVQCKMKMWGTLFKNQEV